MTDVAEQPVNLNPTQVDAILSYAVAGSLYEGTPPADPQAKLNEAATLVYMARRAYANGNHSDVVTQIMFLADVDQNAQNIPAPPAPAAPVVAQQAPQVDPAAAFAPAPQPAAQQNGAGNYDTYTDEQISATIEALQANASVPAIKAEIDKLVAIQSGRQGAAATPQAQVPPAAPPSAVAPQPPPVPGAPMPVPPQPPAGPAAGQQFPEGALDAAGQPRPLADAGPPPVAEAPQPGGQGAAPVAAPAAADRAQLEAQLSGQILLAYGIADVASISTDDLARMLSVPGGPEPIVGAPVSPQRDELEGRIQGAVLKAHGKGRVDVPAMSDEELRWMIEHPQGPRWPGPAAGPAPSQQVAAQPAAPPVQVQAPSSQPTSGIQPGLFQATTTQSDVDALISAERFPLPPEVDAPPQLPFDISRSSDLELRGIHGQFHAVLARVNWVIAQHKDQIYGIECAIGARKVIVRDGLPKTVESKRVTKDEAQAMVDADAEVVRLQAELATARRPLIKLEEISENARRTCARCSREWAMRKGELDSQHGS